MERDFIVYFLNYCLDHYFKSKKEMAQKVDVNVCTLMRVMNPPYKFKAGSVPFQNTLWYCLKHNIDVVQIFRLYVEQREMQKARETNSLLHEPSVWEAPCMGIMMKTISEDSHIRDEHRSILLNASRVLRCCLCQQCTRTQFFADGDECLAIQIMHSTISYYRTAQQ